MSKLNRNHIIAVIAVAVLALVITWLTGYLPVSYRPIALGSYFGQAYTPWMVGFWWFVVLTMFFTSKGHRCAACGSPWIKAID